LISIILTLATLSCKPSNQTAPNVYIALGASVPSGYGLNGYSASPEGRYPSILFKKLKPENVIDEYYNMASSGFTTTTLLEKLNNMGRDELRLFRNARIVTVNIGGNNILMPFLTYLSDSQLVSGAGNIRTGTGGVISGAWGVLHEILSGVGNLVSDSAKTSFSIGGAIRGLRGMLSGLGELIGGTREMIAGSSNAVSAWRGQISPELETVLKKGVQTFSDEFKKIIIWFERNAPNATIIVNTIYNPIPQDILMVSVPISNWANAYIGSINDIIVEESKSRGFLVTDINFHFSNRPELMNFNLNPFSGGLSIDIVHPNIRGHNLIAQLNHTTFSQHLQGK